MKKLIFLMALCATVSAAEAQQKTQVIAHRGFHATEGSAPNTVSSLRNAQKLGIYGSECDVNMTVDDSLLVVHGPWHQATKDPYRVHVQNDDYKTVRSRTCEGGNILPSLHEYLQQLKLDPETRLVLEIKNCPSHEREVEVTRAIVAAVKAAGVVEQTDYIAFSSYVCDELVRLTPGSEIAYLNGDFTPEEIKKRGYTGIDYHMKVLREHPEWIAECHKLGLKVNVWTANEPEDIAYFIGQGVDFITTDNPLEAMRQLGQRPKNFGPAFHHGGPRPEGRPEGRPTDGRKGPKGHGERQPK